MKKKNTSNKKKNHKSLTYFVTYNFFFLTLVTQADLTLLELQLLCFFIYKKL